MIRVFFGLFMLLGVLMADSNFQSSLPKHYSSTLNNGLEVIIIPMDNNSNVVSTNIFYKVGSRNEIMGKSGIAHMLEHLNFKSSKNLKAGEFDRIVKGFGGATNASTGFDYTHYYVNSSSKNMSKTLELFSELMQNLSLKDDEFQPERNVVAEERLWRTDNDPIGYMYFRLFNTAFVYHPYHWTPIGFMEDIRNWTIEDIRGFHRTYYQPKNAAVVIAGDIDEKYAIKEVEKYFGKIKNTDIEIPKVYMQEPKQDGLKKVKVHKQSEVEIITLAYKIPPFNHKDQIALSAISELLTNGNSSLLVQDIVDKKRLAVEIHAYNMDLIDEGVFLVLALANSGVSLDKLENEIKAQLDLIKKGKITQKELNKVKRNMRTSFLYDLESSASVASLFGSYVAKGDLNVLLDFEQNFESLSLEDIIRVANIYFIDSKLNIVTLQK